MKDMIVCGLRVNQGAYSNEW